MTALAETPAPRLDDIMLAMDVVDTLRHRERLIESELAGDARETALIKRLKDIYAAQGIDVPDQILKDGVKALEEKRFSYEPPRGLAVSIAKVYVSRGRWLKPVALVFGLAALATTAYEFGYQRPREARHERVRIELAKILPASLAAARDAALGLAETDPARTRVEAAYEGGRTALREQDATEAKASLAELEDLAAILAQDLTIRVVSKPGEYSGVFRIPDDAPNARNYYLIVEAVDARGEPQALEIASEEDRETKRVSSWGVRVPEAEFDRIAQDKADNAVIENAVIGQKPKGALDPEYAVEGAGGAILEW